MSETYKPASWILPIIVLSQFLCTSLWFTGNVLTGLIKEFHLQTDALGHLTSAVQLGFIFGTLIYALFGIADRFSPSKVFFISALLAAAVNCSVVFINTGIWNLLLFRFLTGFFLAGIYPVGMKLASDHYGKVLGRALGFLVGALVLGTAFPHLIKNYSGDLLWRMIFIFTSCLSVAGGLLIIIFIPNGPFRVVNTRIDFSVVLSIFKNKSFRIAAFGYFGHMWELYAFWAFVPFMIVSWNNWHAKNLSYIELLAFIIIASGSIACVSAGYLSQKFGSKRIAFAALMFSFTCCVLSPLMNDMPFILFAAFLIFWGMVVVADSPMFSTLVALHAPVVSRGTALTITTCIGFSITILSIELLNYLKDIVGTKYLFLFLAPGPLFGILSMQREKQKAQI